MMTFAEIVDRLNNPVVTVTRSVFLGRDEMGRPSSWAKRWEDVDYVHVEFSTEEIGHLTPDQFKSLTKEQQTKVRNAPSSPLP